MSDRSQTRLIETAEFVIDDASYLADDSFLNFDGAIVFSGKPDETSVREKRGFSTYRTSTAGLERHEREIISLLADKRLVVFLVSNADAGDDGLVWRIMAAHGINWRVDYTPYSACESVAPEFNEYVKRFGTGYLQLSNSQGLTQLIVGAGDTFGAMMNRSLVFLPCTLPESIGAFATAVSAATSAVLAYRTRTAREMPAWITNYQFAKEQSFRNELAALHRKVADVEKSMRPYEDAKGVLCFQSDALVDAVTSVIDRFFGIHLIVDDKNVEDATLQDRQERIVAVFEIKGVKGNFTRQNINQVDSHGERLSLSESTPGILIMNTLMSAGLLEDKDVPPHPDIIKKAAADNVLLIRTLDLLRYVELTENGVVEKAAFEKTLLSEAGWLKVEADQIQIVKN